MAKTKITTTIIYVFITVVLTSPRLIEPQTPAAPSPGPDCITDLANLADCLPYVELGSNMTKPDSPCCPEMSNLIETGPICLCRFLAKPSEFGISDINSSRALELPSLCKLVKGSPVGLCEAIGVTVSISSPTPSPSPSQAVAAAAKPSPGISSAQNFVIGLALVLFTCFL